MNKILEYYSVSNIFDNDFEFNQQVNSKLNKSSLYIEFKVNILYNNMFDRLNISMLNITKNFTSKLINDVKFLNINLEYELVYSIIFDLLYKLEI